MKQYILLPFLVFSGFLFAQEDTEESRLGALSYPEMVLVEGGTFTMGDEWGIGSEDELPTHEVSLNNFKISKTEVTVKQYRQFCLETNRTMPNAPSWGWQDNNPITKINRMDAVSYCFWLGKKMGGQYRLPTEAEWEYAARGGNSSKGFKYSGGQSMDSVGWFDENSNGRTQVVASKKPNELGLYDMSGNVWEWCSDWYGKNYYAESPSNNPQGPSSGSTRVLRGGGWGSDASRSRVAIRRNTNPNNRYNFDGFRVVLTQ